MAQLVRLCSISEAPAANSVDVIAAPTLPVFGGKLCVANIDGKFYAMDNDCPHRLGPLGEGTLEDGLVLCPWHAWGFDPKTGTCREFPQAHVRTYPVRVEGNDLLVEIDAG
jgi:nitrite reductase (NADH) small subunit